MNMVDNIKTNKHLYCKWEYYIYKDSNYLPVKRINTVSFVEGSIDGNINLSHGARKNKNFKYLLKALIETCDFDKAVAAFDKANKKTKMQLANYNQSYFDIPVLKDSAIKKGVFLTIKEFLNNSPSIIYYKEKK